MNSIYWNVKDKLNKAGEAVTTGGVPKMPPPPVVPPAPVTPPADEDFDELGYPKTRVEASSEKPPTPSPSDPTKVEVSKLPEKVEKVATGYGEEAPVVPPEPPPKPPEPITDKDLGFELKFDPVVPKEEQERLKRYAKDNGLNEAQTKAYLDMRTGELKNFFKAVEDNKIAAERAKVKQRADWHNELKTDSTFGGEHYAHNVARAERVLEDFMPQTKKELTQRGSMLPPYVMRDLAKLYDVLHPTEKLVNGEPPTPPPDPADNDDGTAFYKQ